MQVQIDDGLRSWVRELRRWFHRHPEPSFEETHTQDKVCDELAGLGIEYRRAGGTGVTADIKGRAGGPVIALRTDMDALRINEAKTALNQEYRSEDEGVMHACGHDGHMAMVLGAARWLQEHRAELGGNVRLIFQPAEEVPPGGALPMIADGCLDGVDAIIAVHVFGNMPSGHIGFRSGPFMATSRTFRVTVLGKPGHHMNPHENVDPIQVACRFVASLQGDIRQRLAPEAVWVLGFGEINGGMQHNQTPSEARVVGTFRTFDEGVSQAISDQIRATLDGLVRAAAKPGIPGLPSYEYEVDPSYPALINDPAFTRRAAEVLRQHFPDVDDAMPPNLGAEDFACYLQKVPGMFIFLGCANPGRGIDAMNHSDRFDIDESALGKGVGALVTLATDFLADPKSYLDRR